MSDDDDNTKETHPSYGTAQFLHVSSSGHNRLFGSALAHHQHTIRLVIRQAERYTDCGHDRVHGNREIVEVELSAAQFSELLTTMNVGTGVPCTIRFHSAAPGPGRVPEPPRTSTEVDRARAAFRERVGGVMDLVQPHLKKMIALSDRLPSKKARDEFRVAVSQVAMEFESNIPFMLEQFREATERVVTAAKSEVEEFVSRAVIAAGLEAIAAGRLTSADLHTALPPEGES